MAMREKDRLGLGSTVSLQGGEHIPREYHRRILKKIAQLTKVIYNLNTKIDENENFVSSLKAIHEAESKRILDDSAAQLKQCEEGFMRERESGQKQIENLRKALENARGERDSLYEKQVSYRKEVEDQLSSLRTQHTSKVQSLVSELERFQGEQKKQLNEVSDLRARFSKKATEDTKALKLQHEEELERVRLSCEQQVRQLKDDIAALRAKHLLEVDTLTEQFQSRLEAQSKSLTSAQRDLLSQERQAWEEKEKQMATDFLEREEQLKQQISSLSTELRVSSDKLALAEQKIRDLESRCDESQAGSGTLRALLEKSEADIECLRGTVSNLQTELDLAREKYKQQTAELQTMSGTVAKLEALRVSNEGVIKSLQSELAGLQDRLKLIQQEKEGIQSSQMSVTETQTAKIKALEKELGKVRGEKQELHAQFAREIEAAHAQLSQRETELEQHYHRAMQDAQEQHSKALASVEEDKRSSLESLKHQLQSERDQDLQQLRDSHDSQLSELRRELSDKTSRLELSLQELQALRDRLLKEEQGLGSATSQIDQLRADLTQCQSSLLSSQRECADVQTENAQLRLTVESLRREKVEGESTHSEQLRRTRADLTAELEALWKERVKRETASVRSELAQRHSEEKRVALHELAGLKDTALRQAEESWEREKGRLLDKIEGLERELRRLQQVTSASLEEAKTSSDSQISSLRKELDNELQRHKEALASLQRGHCEQLESLKAESEQEKNALTAQLSVQHKQELLALQQANQLAVSVLRKKMESEKRESLAQAQEQHYEKVKNVEEKLGEQFGGELARVNKEHLAEVERFRQQIENVVTQSQKQMQTQASIADGLRREIEGRDSELGMLRDKGNSLTVAIADLKKQLTMREQELQLAKREAKSTLRIREQQLVATHHTELETVNAQHRHKAQQLLTDFNKAKSILTSKIHELEKQLSEWEHRYKMRESKPEDLEAIKGLRMMVREQEQKIKDLVAEKRVCQLELMNREKNYNKLFNVNPQVGVLNPLQLKQKKSMDTSSDSHKYASAPSLLAPLSPEPPIFNPPQHLTPLPNSLKLTSLPNNDKLTSSNSHLSKKTHITNFSAESKPQKLVMLRDSPLTQKRRGPSGSGRKTLGSHSGPLQSIETQSQATVSNQKHTMTVQ